MILNIFLKNNQTNAIQNVHINTPQCRSTNLYITKMATMPIYCKNAFKNLLQNPTVDDLRSLYVAYVGPTKFVQKMILG